MGFAIQVASVLDAAGIPYMLTGSMAMSLYGVPRMTRDIDLVVELTTADVERVVHLFCDDCYVNSNAVRDAVQRRGMFNIIHFDSSIKVDFIVRKASAYREEEFARRRRVQLPGGEITVVAPEDLVLSKLLWACQSESELQLSDVRKMLRRFTQFDWHYLDKWADELGVCDAIRRAREHG